MEEKRTIQISLSQAVDWYNSDNEILKMLALSIFEKDELKLTYGDIKRNVPYCDILVSVPIEIGSNFLILGKLSMLAKYFNKDWHKTNTTTGYFINGIKDGKITTAIHETLTYPGVIYFKNRADIYAAINIIGRDRIKKLFG